MSESNITIKCGKCGGTGSIVDIVGIDKIPVSRPCDICSGTGYLLNGKLDTTEIMELLGRINGTTQAIWNKIK